MIELAIQRIAISVASEAAGHANPTAEKDSRVAAGYIAIVGAISAILAVSCAMLAYQWALALPRRSNTIKPDEAPTWAIVLAVMIFATIGLLGTALAPTRVLKSRALTWLVAISGMKSITGLRVILIVLSAIAGAVSFGWFSVADGL